MTLHIFWAQKSSFWDDFWAQKLSKNDDFWTQKPSSWPRNPISICPETLKNSIFKRLLCWQMSQCQVVKPNFSVHLQFEYQNCTAWNVSLISGWEAYKCLTLTLSGIYINKSKLFKISDVNFKQINSSCSLTFLNKYRECLSGSKHDGK